MVEDPGVMTLGLFALAAFLLIGTVAAFLGRNAGVDAIPFSSADSARDATAPHDTGSTVRLGLLPREIRESSGIARSGRGRDVWWTHNDGNDGRLFAVSSRGALLGTWRLEDVPLTDVEDIASAPCPGAQSTLCLYLADTGDNRQSRAEYAVHVVTEPELDGATPANGVLEQVAVLRFTYGGQSHDAEALAVLQDGNLLVITKGQDGGAELFRLPPPVASQAAVVTAESLGMLPIDVDRKTARVTAAALSPSGARLAVRSDIDVRLFELSQRRFIARCNFDGAGQQGEAVDFADETTLMLTFEADGNGRAPIVRARCGA
jgi:hypothetical protein